MENENLPALTPEMTSGSVSVFFNEKSFELAQRQAKLLSSSSVIPSSYQNNLPNCVVAIEMASRVNMSPIMVMQNLDIIKGRPCWSAKFVIAVVNSCGRFSRLQFKYEGEGMNKSCIAFAKEKQTGEIVEGIKVSMQMAQAEGWLTKEGSKWKTMPDLMLMYRAGSFFGKMYCGDLLLGIPATDEIEDANVVETTTIQSKLANPVPAEKTGVKKESEQQKLM